MRLSARKTATGAGFFPSDDLIKPRESHESYRPNHPVQLTFQTAMNLSSWARRLLLLTLCLSGALHAPVTLADTSLTNETEIGAAPQRRTVSVSGEAERRVQPDMALLSVQVLVQSERADEARVQVDEVTANALAMVRKMGVADADIDSTGIRVDPKYRWVERNREQELVGYEVSRSLELRILDLDALGKLITGLSDLGVNRISPPVLGLQSRELLHQQVLAEAASNARLRAVAMAEALNAKVGEVVDLSASNAPLPQAMNRQRARISMAMESASSDNAEFEASYSVGYVTIRSSVLATFALR